MTVGEQLRRARLEAGLTLYRVSERTKVPTWILDGIERDDLARIPGGVFIRGYLAAFAGAVGLNPEDILRAQFGERRAPVVPISEIEPRRPTGTPLWQYGVMTMAVIAVGAMWASAARRPAGDLERSASTVIAARPAPPRPEAAPVVTAVAAIDTQVEPPASAVVTVAVAEPAPQPVEAVQPATLVQRTDPAADVAAVDARLSLVDAAGDSAAVVDPARPESH